MTDKAGSFDRDEYPERVGCNALPSVEEDTTEVEVQDWDGNTTLLHVPSDAVARLTMPRLGPGVRERLPGEIQDAFERSIGVGVLACRVANRNEGLVSIEVPTPSGEPQKLVVREDQLARRHRS